MTKKSKAKGGGRGKNNKETEAETFDDDLFCNENSTDRKDFQEPSAVKDNRTKSEEGLKTTSIEIWKDKKLRSVILIIGVLHVFQICGITYMYLLHRDTNTHVKSQSCQKVPFQTVPGDSSEVCGCEGAVLSAKYETVADNLNTLHKEFQNYVKERQQETKAWVNQLSNCNKTLHNMVKHTTSMEEKMHNFYHCNKTLESMITNITGLEENTHAVLEMINVLQNNYTKKSEEEKQHLKQVEANFTEKMLEVEQNISLFNEVVQKKNIEINDERGLSEEILQNNSSKDLRKLYDETDKKIDDQKEKIDELKKKMFVDTERINASIKKLDGDFNEFNRTFVKEEKTTNEQFTYVKQRINELLNKVTEMDEKAEKVKDEVDAEKSKVESTETDIKELKGHVNDLKSHNTKTDKDTNEKFSIIDERVNELVTMVKDVDTKIDEKTETINREVDAEKRNANSTIAYAMELEGKLKELHNRTTEREKQVNEKFISTEKRVNELVIMVKRIDKKIDEKAETINKKVDAEKENFESTMAGVHGRLNYFSVELNDINLYIVGFLLLVVVGVICTAYKILLPRQSPLAVYDQTAAKSAPQSRVGGKLPSEIVEGISRQNLEPGINLISFTSSTQQFHKNLIDAVPKPSSTQIHSCLIHRSSDIPHTTPSKVVFIFVDFNERNIILEDPETEIGDLRRLTTQGLLNMGCDVFVIYVKDRGSQDLPRDQLYSPRLYSVERHPILHKLKEKHRVLSLYDRFHPHQVKFLEDCFKRL